MKFKYLILSIFFLLSVSKSSPLDKIEGYWVRDDGSQYLFENNTATLIEVGSYLKRGGFQTGEIIIKDINVYENTLFGFTKIRNSDGTFKCWRKIIIDNKNENALIFFNVQGFQIFKLYKFDNKNRQENITSISDLNGNWIRSDDNSIYNFSEENAKIIKLGNILARGGFYNNQLKIRNIKEIYSGYYSGEDLLNNSKGEFSRWEPVTLSIFKDNLILKNNSQTRQTSFSRQDQIPQDKIVNVKIASGVTIAVVDFEGIGISENDARALSERLRNDLFTMNKYKLIERSLMQVILDEQGFQISGCTTNECIVEMGKLLGAEYIIGGSISKVGSTFSISSRIISVESSLIIRTSTYDYTGEIDILLTQGMKKIAYDLSN